MDCRAADLTDLLYGFLDEDAEARVRAHLEGCRRCRAGLERLEVEKSILAGAAALPSSRPEPVRGGVPWVPLAFAAALLVGLVALLAPRDDGSGSNLSYSATGPQEKKEQEKKEKFDAATLEEQIARLEKALETTTDEQDRGRIQASLDKLRRELVRVKEGKVPEPPGKFDKKKVPGRVDELSAAIKGNPNDPLLYIARAEEYLGLKRWDEAMKDAEEAIRLDAAKAKGYFIVGKACHFLGQAEAADKAFASAVEREPGLAAAVKEIKSSPAPFVKKPGPIDPKTDKLRMEVDALMLKLKTSTDQAEQNKLKMRITELQQEIKAGGGKEMPNVKELDARLQREPNDVEALVARARVHLEAVNGEAALKDLNRAIELKPLHASAWLRRGVAYAMLGDLNRGSKEAKYGEQLEGAMPKEVEWAYGMIKKFASPKMEKPRPPGDRTQQIAALTDRLEELRAMAANPDLKEADRERARTDAERVATEIEKLKSEPEPPPPARKGTGEKKPDPAKKPVDKENQPEK